jgi:hypothetical protein
MPPKKVKKPKQKPKQKQKQKQIVKQNVKVTVQSSGGSGGGGTPSYIPQQYSDNRSLGLLDEISKAIRGMPASSRAPALYSNTPANDNATVNAVFNAPLNTNKPVELGLNNERFTRKKSKPQKVERSYSSESESSIGSEGYASSGGEYIPSEGLGFGFPSSLYTKTPYGKTVPRFGESVEPSLASEAIGGGKKEEPVFSGFSVYGGGSRM